MEAKRYIKKKGKGYRVPKKEFEPTTETLQYVENMLTQHCWDRMSQRGISILGVCAAILYGTYYKGHGAEVAVIGRKEIRVSKVKLHPFSGIHVLLTDGRVVTTYRNRVAQLRYRY